MEFKLPLGNLFAGIGLVLLGLTPYHIYFRSAVGFIVSPLSYGFYSIGQKSVREFNFWINLRNLSEENSKLSKDVEKLKQVELQLYELGKENDFLKKELGIKDFTKKRETQLARIVGWDLQGGAKTVGFFLDRGRSNNVTEGDIVVLNGSLVGKIIESWQTLSICQIATDTNFVASAVTQQSRIIGLVSGQFGTKIAMEHILQSESPIKGEAVITTGQDGKFPAGLLLGYVESVAATASAVEKIAVITPAVQFKNLEQVLIWKKE
jgi:rod shape-determining protein MreC